MEEAAGPRNRGGGIGGRLHGGGARRTGHSGESCGYDLSPILPARACEAAPRGLVPPPPMVGLEDLSNEPCPMSASPRGHPVQLRVTRHSGSRRGPRRHLGGRGHRSVSRLQTREFFLIKLIRAAPGQLLAARRVRHRGSGSPLSCPPASRGHLTRWGGRRRGSARAIGRQARSARVRTRRTQRVSARWIGRLRINRSGDCQHDNHRYPCQEMFHSLILICGCR